MNKVYLYYNEINGYITYERESLSITCILLHYDDIIKFIGFEDGLLTILMRMGTDEIEEYVDFNAALDMLNLNCESNKYFNNITINDLVLSKENGGYIVNREDLKINKIVWNDINLIEVIFRNFYKLIFTLKDLQLVSTNVGKEYIESIRNIVKLYE